MPIQSSLTLPNDIYYSMVEYGGARMWNGGFIEGVAMWRFLDMQKTFLINKIIF